MRIWDVNPGYLNRQSLLGEHRELHAIVSIVINHKRGYAHHPETLRWAPYGWALARRHRLLAAEMALRGYTDRSPVELKTHSGVWPDSYVDPPGEQFDILAEKYRDKAQGRIPLPMTTQQLWSQHKYSVLARDVPAYKTLGSHISSLKGKEGFHEIALQLTELLRTPPTPGGIRNTLQHMWGHVSAYEPVHNAVIESWSLNQLLNEIQKRAFANQEPYLLPSTTLSELHIWI
jgi:uncharacterized protein YbgA (DUF1722 family)